jgi:tetratricopeptide (TPR) repeat protein
MNAPLSIASASKDLDSLWNPADVPGSESRFRELLPEVERTSQNDSSERIELLSLIARAQAHQHKFAEAKATLASAEQLLEDPQGGHRASARIRWLIECGRLHILDKTPSQALKLFAEAWSLAQNSGEDFFAVEVAQLMAANEPLKAQQEWINRAVQIAEGSPQERAKRHLGTLYSSLGWKLYDLRQFEKAIETFQKSLSHLKNHGSEREIFIAKWSIGKVLRAMNRTEEALAMQKSLLAELGIGGLRDGRLFEELAECLHTLKRSSEAQLYFELAYRELSSDEWVNDNQAVRLKRMKDLGKVKN